MITGELIRAQNFVDDAVDTLRRIHINIGHLDTDERKALAEHIKTKTITFETLLKELGD